MGKLDFIPATDLDEVDRRGNYRHLIQNFAIDESINVIWAKAGGAKTTFAFYFAGHLAKQGLEVAYIDTDNGALLLKTRGYDKIIKEVGENLKYINADMLDDPQKQIAELLENIEKNAGKDKYKNCAFVLDSLKFFLDGRTDSDARINRLIVFAKIIRRSGGSVWILSHALKSGDRMEGGRSITDSIDEQWQVEGIGIDELEAHFLLTPYKYRMPVKKIGFSVCRKTITLKPLDPLMATMTIEEKDFVDKVKIALETEPLGQNALLKAVGVDHADRFGRESLAKYTGKFWKMEQDGKRRVYKILDTVDTLTQ